MEEALIVFLVLLGPLNGADTFSLYLFGAQLNQRADRREGSENGYCTGTIATCLGRFNSRRPEASIDGDKISILYLGRPLTRDDQSPSESPCSSLLDAAAQANNRNQKSPQIKR